MLVDNRAKSVKNAVKILYENKRSVRPKVSIVLLDWSVREHYHGLDYLSNQTIPRNQYEILWIEYYDVCSPGINRALRKSLELGFPPVIDKWVVMNIPRNTYYHKHLMYNTGIVLSSGQVVVFCDSDAMVRPTFVESMVKEFEKDPNIVLHMDQFRNNNKGFYPFDFPSFEEVTGEGCVNNVNGKPRGIVDKSDTLHLRNYGACMVARREDLIAIGGADEHIDYLGHICGPYEMTFRLVNAGKKEIWHEDEFLYHVWHPGQGGTNNYFGPHDGKHMSTTALEVRHTGRIMPLVENPAIEALRTKLTDDQSTLLSLIIPDGRGSEWSIKGKKWKEYDIGNVVITVKELVNSKEGSFRTILLLNNVLFRMCVKHVYRRTASVLKSLLTFLLRNWQLFFSPYRLYKKLMSILTFKPLSASSFDIFKLGLIRAYIEQTIQYNRYTILQCQHCLHRLASQGVRNVAVFGANDVAEVLYILTKIEPIKISTLYDDIQHEERFCGLRVLPLSALNGYNEKIIVSGPLNTDEKIEALRRIGIKGDRIARVF